MTRSILFLIPAALVLAGCGVPRQEAAAKAPAAMNVSVTSVTLQQWPTVYEATGTVRARASSTVSAKWMGYVREVRANIGDRVQEGQVLVTLDARDLDAGAGRANAARDEVQNGIPEAESAIAAAQSNLDLVQATFRRMTELYSKKSISDQEYDEASAHLKAAQASVAMARARRTQLDSRLQQADQEVRAAHVARTYATIEAPCTGVVTAKSVEPGILAVPGAPLFTIEKESYRLEVSVEESKLSVIRPGQAAPVQLDGNGAVLDSHVSEIVPVVDAGARAAIVKIDLPGSASLRSGMYGRALFTLGKRDVLTLPASAWIEHGQLESVFVVDGGVARTRMVALGSRAGDRVEVLSGLSAGERVVFPVPAALVDGTPVEVRQ